MKFFLSLCALFTLLSAYVHAETVDYVECKREKSTFRQFCYVNESKTTKTMTVGRYAEVNGESLDLLPVYESGKITLLSLNGGDDHILTLTSLAPQIKADIDWVHSRECQVSDLWYDRIWLSVSDLSSLDVRNLEQINVGYSSFNINLSDVKVDGFSPWTVASNSNTDVFISSSVYLDNLDHTDDRPLAYQRIPTYCKMNVEALRIGFDPLDMNGDLENLASQADTTISLKTRASVVHANLIDGQRGAVCSVYNLGQSLFTLEFAWTWDDLSYESQTLISDGVKEAVNLGAIPASSIPNGNDYFDYFKGESFQADTSALCAGTSPIDYTVSIDPFMENGEIQHQQGYNNAVIYGHASTNLVEIIKAAWAINNVAVVEIEGYIQKEWLTSPIVLNEF